MNSSKKKNLGQHNTENVNYILKGFEAYIKGKEVIDPFCGDFDLLDWALQNGATEILGVDIDETKTRADFHDDTLTYPLDYSGSLVLTNPPYLAKNKTNDKSLFVLYNTDDLYKASIQTFMESKEGILIVPVNFICSKEYKTRKMFLDKFSIEKATIFEEQVFPDTTSTVIAFYYKIGDSNSFPLLIQPSNKEMKVILDKKYNYRFGTEFFKYLKPANGIKRLVQGNEKPDTNIYVHCLDTSKPIRAEYQEEHYYGITSDRSKCSLVIDKELSVVEQKELVEFFNAKLQYFRDRYNSLFLSSYREGKRKRMGFTEVYQFMKGCLEEIKLMGEK